MCLLKIRNAIAETENDLQAAAAAMAAAAPKGQLPDVTVEALQVRLDAFKELRTVLEKIKNTHYNGWDDGSMDMFLPPQA